MKLKQYPEYNDSKMRWLNDIPENWEARKIKYVFKERSKKGFPDLPMLAATQTKGVVPKEKYENRTVIAQKDLHLLKLVEKGDFVISLRSFQGGIEYAYYRGIISPAYTVMIPSERINSSYFRYLAKSQPFIGLLKTCVTGIREGQNINYDILRISSIPLPSIPEQKIIGKYLDFKSAKITKFIRNKRRLIQLLKEQKQAIINQAVTRGINPDVKMKPSGIDWIGDTPEHWGIVPLRWYIRISSGDFRNTDDVKITPDAEYIYPVIGGNGIMGYTNDFNSKEDTIVLGRVGALCGNVHLITESAWITDNALRLRKIKQFFIPYLVEQLRVMNLNRLSNSSAQPLITGEIVKAQKVVLPRAEEQKDILEVIRERTINIDLTIEKANKEIELIQEYRTRLISDVVTGKVDVRDIKVEDVTDEEITDDFDSSEDEQKIDDSVEEVLDEE